MMLKNSFIRLRSRRRSKAMATERRPRLLAVDECKKDNPPNPCAQEGMLRRIPPKRWRHHGLCPWGSICVLLLFVLFALNSVWAVPAFPGAEGYGAVSIGGRGGQVIKVSNLNDSGAGSLRAAVAVNAPRIIVFTVSGNIFLNSRLTINRPYITIAGQTAPGDGITLIGNQTTVETHDVIIRYLRFRAGDLNCAERDALDDGNSPNTYNIIIDHCTASWGIDETLSFYYGHDTTIQWCMITESLYDSCHSKGPHGYGGIWGGTNSSFHHNLFAHHSSRNPRFASGCSVIDHRNNVIYNWGGNSTYGGEGSNMNIINNYYKYGPATMSSTIKRRIFQASDAYAKAYINGNYVDGYPAITADNWFGGGVAYDNGASESTLRVSSPFTASAVTTTTAQEAYNDVLAGAGDSFPGRDFLDSRIVSEVQTRGGSYGSSYADGHKGIIDSQFDLCPNGGLGVCPECSDGDNDYCWLPVLNSAAAPVDSDNDAMPDEWEMAHCLNPYDQGDAGGDRDDDGYTNIEEYINWLLLGQSMPPRADVNCDNTVDFYDFSEFVEHYGSSFGTPLYDEKYDFYPDGVISLEDLFYIADDWLWYYKD